MGYRLGRDKSHCIGQFNSVFFTTECDPVGFSQGYGRRTDLYPSSLSSAANLLLR